MLKRFTNRKYNALHLVIVFYFRKCRKLAYMYNWMLVFI